MEPKSKQGSDWIRIKAPKKAVLTLILIIIWSVFLWLALDAFAPNGNYSSDSAIPVLMSNEERPITAFNFYYYGTDRWGGWPFLVTQFIHRSTGYHWSDQSLFKMQALWIFIGVLVMVALSRRDRFAVLIAYLIALCLHSETRLQIYTLSQVYAWQLTALLLSWYSIRRLFDIALESPQIKNPIWKNNAWRFLAFGCGLLATWSSVASTPIIIFLIGLETSRAYLKGDQEKNGRRFLRQSLEAFILIGVATLFEFLLKWNYHRYGLKNFGHDFRTHFALDTGYLRENLSANLHNIGKLSWWPLYLLPTLAIFTLGCVFFYAFLKRRRALLERLKTIVVDDTVILIIGTYAIAAITFVLAVLVNHVRINNYDDRFLTPTFLFGPISGLLIIYLIVDLAAKSSRKSSYLKTYARPAFLLTGILLLVFKFPVRTSDPYYQKLNETALALAKKAPHGILMGGYWETYVFTSLQPTSAMTAIPIEGHENRMPWTKELVRHTGQVVLEYRHTKLGDSKSPPERLTQYCSSFRLIDPTLYENEEYAFALYVNETQ